MTKNALYEARWHTPRSPDRHTDAPHVVKRLTAQGFPPSRWQRDLLEVALERIDGPDSPWAYGRVSFVVGRRCGKTIVEMGAMLTRALRGPLVLPNGRRVPFRGAHTAQNLVRARERFLEDLAEPYIATLTEEDRKESVQVMRNLASTSLRTHHARVKHPEASVVQVYAPTPTGMRSSGLAHIGIDEALTFDAEQGQALMAAARPTMASMQGHGQMWTLSNVGLAMQGWLPVLRDRGRLAVEQGKREGLCYVEYSVPDDADPTDERVWWECYPALGDGLVRPEELREDVAELGEEVFAAEYLNRWPGEGEVDDPGLVAVDVNRWLRAVRPGSSIPAGAPMWAGVDMSEDGTEMVMVAVAHDPDGGLFAEVARSEPLMRVPDLAGMLDQWRRQRPGLRALAFDPRTCGSVVSLMRSGLPTEELSGGRWQASLKDLVDALRDGRITHPHGVGDVAGDVLVRHVAAGRLRRSGDSVSLSRTRSTGAVSGLVALMGAVHLAVRVPAVSGFKIL